nr:ISAzo13 family transposase [uncultured Methanospirillum sp.]
MAPHLNERQKRLLAAIEAESYGRGGVTLVSQLTGVSRSTINIGREELKEGIIFETDRVRHSGGGRKKIQEYDPQLESDLDALVEPTSRGDPESPLRWTCLSTRNLAKLLREKGHQVSHTTVAKILDKLNYSVQGAKKTIEGQSHEDRNAQFEFINESVKLFQEFEQPIISVDCKKKENIGNFKNNGCEWQPKGSPLEVNSHDFMDLDLGKAIPYGVYDINNNSGWVNVGVDHETSEFAVESIRRWWKTMGQEAYPNAKFLLITADSGGSNGYRRKAWKADLQNFSDETGLIISTCHFPPGTSKWNKIEHRLFSAITQNWRGRPLISLETIVNLIGNTKTETGLKVECDIDTSLYPTGLKISDETMEQLRIHPNNFHGEWNYTITPRRRSNN